MNGRHYVKSTAIDLKNLDCCGDHHRGIFFSDAQPLLDAKHSIDLLAFFFLPSWSRLPWRRCLNHYPFMFFPRNVTRKLRNSYPLFSANRIIRNEVFFITDFPKLYNIFRGRTMSVSLHQSTRLEPHSTWDAPSDI